MREEEKGVGKERGMEKKKAEERKMVVGGMAGDLNMGATGKHVLC